MIRWPKGSAQVAHEIPGSEGVYYYKHILMMSAAAREQYRSKLTPTGSLPAGRHAPLLKGSRRAPDVSIPALLDAVSCLEVSRQGQGIQIYVRVYVDKVLEALTYRLNRRNHTTGAVTQAHCYMVPDMQEQLSTAQQQPDIIKNAHEAAVCLPDRREQQERVEGPFSLAQFQLEYAQVWLLLSSCPEQTHLRCQPCPSLCRLAPLTVLRSNCVYAFGPCQHFWPSVRASNSKHVQNMVLDCRATLQYGLPRLV